MLKFPDKNELIKRENVGSIKNQFSTILNNKYLFEILNVINLPAVILNDKRQIVYSNQKAAFYYGVNVEDLLGKRHGECLNCVNSKNGCGVSDVCEFCGAFNSIMGAIIEGSANEQECRILSKTDDKIIAYDLNVKSAPITIDNTTFLIVIFDDISNEKRKKTLERIFFHDVLNTINSMSGLINYLASKKIDEETDEIMHDLTVLTNRLTDEVLEQRDLIAAENGELKIRCSAINTQNLIKDLIKQASFLIPNNNLKFIISEKNEDVNFVSDKVILQRIIFNMLKNAAESENFTGNIIIGCYLISNNDLLFFVQNSKYIEEETQLLIFQRNFSTKSITRGLGTFSMKLLAENYLEGKVFFKSEVNFGTTFYLQLPLNRIKCEEFNG